MTDPWDPTTADVMERLDRLEAQVQRIENLLIALRERKG